MKSGPCLNVNRLPQFLYYWIHWLHDEGYKSVHDVSYSDHPTLLYSYEIPLSFGDVSHSEGAQKCGGKSLLDGNEWLASWSNQWNRRLGYSRICSEWDDKEKSPVSFTGFRFHLSFVTEIPQNSDKKKKRQETE